MFLARVSESEACADAADASGMVGRQAGAEQGSGPIGQAHSAETGVESGASVGMRFETSKLETHRGADFKEPQRAQRGRAATKERG
jgi:hypothetical protein